LAEQIKAEAETARTANLAAFDLGAPAAPPIAAAPTPPAPPPLAATPPSSPVAASGGPWRVQLGAFAVSANAEALWTRVEGRAELAGAQRLMVPTGRVTRLQAGGFPSRAAAEAACAALKRAGYDCLAIDR